MWLSFLDIVVFLSLVPHVAILEFIQVAGTPRRAPSFLCFSFSSCLTQKTLSMKALPTLRKPASQVGFDWAPLSCELPLTTEIADVAALALPEFDDPNIDKDEAIAGVLGKVT